MSLSTATCTNDTTGFAPIAAVPGQPSLSYADAAKQLKKVGTSRAEGDALRAMYAQLLAGRMRGADPARFYAYLKHNDDLIGRYKSICDDPWAYTDGLLTNP